MGTFNAKACLGDAKKRRGFAKKSRAFFAWHYLGLATPSHVQRWIKDYHSKQLFEGPRGHGKTFCRSLIVPLHDICFNRNSRILLIGKNQGEAVKRLRVIRTQLEKNEKLIRDFGDFKTGEKTWTDKNFYIRRPNEMEKDPTVEAVGLGGAITGGRFSRIIVDDPIDDQNVKNARIRKEMVDWLFGTVFELLDPDGQIDVILTRKHYHDLAKSLRDKKAFKIIHDKAIVRYPENFEIVEELVDGQLIPVGVKISGDPGEVLWPERWPMEKLLLKRYTVGSILFDRENQNIVRSETDSQFPLEHLERAKEKGKGLGWTDNATAVAEGWKIFQAWDPAFVDDERKAEENDTDYVVGLTIGYKPETGERKLLKGVRFRGKSPYAVVETIKQEAAMYPDRLYIAVENNSLGRFHELEVKRSTDLPIIPHTTDSRKHDAWEGVPALSATFENGKWILPYDGHEVQEFVDAMTSELFGLGQEAHDDTVMALWIAECIIRRWKIMEEKRQRRQSRPSGENRPAGARS